MCDGDQMLAAGLAGHARCAHGHIAEHSDHGIKMVYGTSVNDAPMGHIACAARRTPVATYVKTKLCLPAMQQSHKPRGGDIHNTLIIITHLCHGLEHPGGDSGGQHGHHTRVIVGVVPPPAAPHPVGQQDPNLIATECSPHPCTHTWCEA